MAQKAINGTPAATEVEESTRSAVEELGWSDCEPALLFLQSAMDTAARAGYPVTRERLLAYAGAVQEVARYDLDALLADPAVQTPSGALRHVAVGTVVTHGVLVALRRMAQEQESNRRFGPASAS